MNMNQFTQKSLAAIQGAQDIAVEHGNQQIEQEHLLLALLRRRARALFPSSCPPWA